LFERKKFACAYDIGIGPAHMILLLACTNEIVDQHMQHRFEGGKLSCTYDILHIQHQKKFGLHIDFRILACTHNVILKEISLSNYLPSGRCSGNSAPWSAATVVKKRNVGLHIRH
jgi:hypothetical protein